MCHFLIFFPPTFTSSILSAMFTGACGPPEKLSLALAPRLYVLRMIVKHAYWEIKMDAGQYTRGRVGAGYWKWLGKSLFLFLFLLHLGTRLTKFFEMSTKPKNGLDGLDGTGITNTLKKNLWWKIKWRLELLGRATNYGWHGFFKLSL